jgi:glycosyltransferase involved in cell wall biosynthesis
MPLVVLEAQALGKAVVASRVGSLPEMISDRVTGLLCDAGDVEDFCEQILRLAGDRKARESMGAAARLSVRRSYSAGQMVEAYDLVFRKVRENRSGKCSAHGAP